MKIFQCFSIIASIQLLATPIHAATSLFFNISSEQYDNVQAGSNFNIVWTSPEPVTLSVLNANTYSEYLVLGTGLTGTQFTWFIPSTTPTDRYAFQISFTTKTESQTSYSVPFLINGLLPASSVAPSIATNSISSTSQFSTSYVSQASRFGFTASAKDIDVSSTMSSLTFSSIPSSTIPVHPCRHKHQRSIKRT